MGPLQHGLGIKLVHGILAKVNAPATLLPDADKGRFSGLFRLELLARRRWLGRICRLVRFSGYVEFAGR